MEPFTQAASLTAYFKSIDAGRSLWWHWIAGFLFICALFIAGAIGLSVLSAALLPSGKATTYFVLLLTFLPIFLAIPFIHRVWHGRAVRALLTSAKAFRWGYMWRAGLILALFLGLASLAEYLIWPEAYAGVKINSDMGSYLPLLFITLLLVPFQAASEEFLCRGYLNQALIKYLKSPWVVFVLTSAGFAALHYWNPEAAGQLWPYLASIFTFGMAMCVLLYFEGGIESAIGAHIANNIFVFALLGYEDPDLPNTALLTLGPPKIGWGDFVVEVALTAMFISLILWANRRFSRAKT